MSDKQKVIEAVSKLPESATLEDIRANLQLMANLREGLADADAGRVIPQAAPPATTLAPAFGFLGLALGVTYFLGLLARRFGCHGFPANRLVRDIAHVFDDVLVLDEIGFGVLGLGI